MVCQDSLASEYSQEKTKSTKQSKDSFYYTCPMHPEIRTSEPGRCPKCGMNLEKKTLEVKKPAKKNIQPKAKAVEADTTHQIHGEEKQKSNEHQNPQPIDSTAIINQAVEHQDQYIGKSVEYHLYISDTVVNYAGKDKRAIAVNGSIPAPTLYFTEGDTAVVYVHNQLKKESTSVHWHGIILPNQFDGVPYLTQMPIKAGDIHLYKFPVVQNGTYWYHSHTKLQEQVGIYGVLIFSKRKEPAIAEYPVLLSEWINEKPSQVHRSLHNATDWYAIKKHSTQNYVEAIGKGYFWTKVINEWKRMLAMERMELLLTAERGFIRFFQGVQKTKTH